MSRNLKFIDAPTQQLDYTIGSQARSRGGNQMEAQFWGALRSAYCVLRYSDIPTTTFLVGNYADSSLLVETAPTFARTQLSTPRHRLKSLNNAGEAVRIFDVTHEPGRDTFETPVIFGEAKPIKQ